MPEAFPYDRSSKWLIQHHGDSILRLGGLQGPFAWRPLQAEVVQPRKLPDGLIEVKFPNQREADLFVLEISTYPDPRLAEQILRDTTMVFSDRRVLPEVLAIILCRRGGLQTEDAVDLSSRRGWTRWQANWRVVEMWKTSAADLLATGDVGLLPWVPLAEFRDPPESVLQECRQGIDEKAPPAEHANLLAVAQVLTRLRHKDPHLLNIFGGHKVMIESPLIQELVAERFQRAILKILESRLGSLPQDLAPQVQAVQDEDKLVDLISFAASCRDLEAFRERLQS